MQERRSQERLSYRKWIITLNIEPNAIVQGQRIPNIHTDLIKQMRVEVNRLITRNQIN